MQVQIRKSNFFIKRSNFFIVLIILAAVFAVYIRALPAEFTFDDRMYVVNNPRIRHLSNFLNIPWNRFLTFLSFAVNYAISGNTAFDFRFVNVLIHAANALLVFFLIKLTFKAYGIKRLHGTVDTGTIPALGAALIFAVHPIETQAVTYITQRFVSLATFFYLFSIVFYIKYRLEIICDGSRRSRIIFYALAYVAAILAQFSKEISFTLPAVIALYEFTFFKDKSSCMDFKNRIYRLIPFALIFLIIPLIMFAPWSPIAKNTVADKIRIMQLDELQHLTKYTYLMTQFRVIITYLRLLIYPANQVLIYDYPLYKSFFIPQVMASFLFLLFLFCGTIYWLIRSINNDDFYGRLAAFGVLWFFITISIESSIIPIKHVIFEHRVYLPSIGIFTAFSIVIYYTAQLIAKKVRLKTSASGIAVVSVIFLSIPLGIATISRNTIWMTQISLWQDVINKAPNLTIGYENTAFEYRKKKQYEKAFDYYVLAANHSTPEEFMHEIEMIAGIFFALERYDDSIYISNIALSLYPDKGLLRLNKALSYSKLGLNEKAFEEYTLTIKNQPELIAGYKNFIVFLTSLGRYDEALDYVEKAIAVDPMAEDILINNGNILELKGEYKAAKEKYLKVLWINPDYEFAKARLAALNDK